MKKKGIGFWFALISAAAGIIDLLILLLYRSNGGSVRDVILGTTIAAIVCMASLLLGEKPWADFAGIIGAVLFTYSMMIVISDGYGNIIDAVQGIVMFGKAELASLNYAMIGASLCAILAAILACFTKKEKA